MRHDLSIILLISEIATLGEFPSTNKSRFSLPSQGKASRGEEKRISEVALVHVLKMIAQIFSAQRLRF